MASLRQILARIFFWAYERGTWQYDLAVIVIVVFVLLTPRSWFHDQPQVGMPAASDQVKLMLFSDDGHRQVYNVDARVLAPPEQTPALKMNCIMLCNAPCRICATDAFRSPRSSRSETKRA